VRGAASGLLAGRTVAIKDNTAVAGVPMRNGTKILSSYVPEFDATIVTRILDAGTSCCQDV
jgi:amidase